MTEPEAPIEYRIELTLLALEMLAEVNDQRHREGLTNRIEKLKSEPEKQGKPLGDILKGYRSVRAVGERYRIIYKVDRNLIVVLIVVLDSADKATEVIFMPRLSAYSRSS